MSHLPVLPVVLPLALGALLLVVGHRRILAHRAIGLAGLAAQVVLGVLLVRLADGGAVTPYLLGNWEAHIGIALAVDRLSAGMVLLTALLGLAALLYACAGWDRRAPHFHAFFQFQIAGLSGAFLTGDLFNLFVFFEVLLIASYGLMLSGGRGVRMRAGLHYVVFNVTASMLFLVGLGLIYGLTGTLNMAEMAVRVAAAPAENAALIKATGGILLVVFCAKAALLPLYFWLPEAYSRAPAPVAALFAIGTKLGLYAVLRVFTLVFGAEAGAAANLAWPWLLPIGAVTLVLSAFGMLAASSLRALTSYLVIGSAATLFIAFALANVEALSAGLYYLLHSTVATGALFLIANLLRAQRRPGGDSLRRIGATRQHTLIALLFFVAAVSISGLPPLSGFIGKFALLGAVPTAQAGWLWTVILASSLLTIVALARAGSHLFWREPNVTATTSPGLPLLPAQAASALALLALGIALTLGAGPALRYTQAAAQQLLAPSGYIDALRQAQPVPSPHAATMEATP